MINTLGRSALPQRLLRTRSLLGSTLLSAFCADCGEKPFFGNSLFGFALILILGRLLMPTHSARAATPTLTHTSNADVIIHLLDANHQPLAGVTVNLVLNRYGDIIEEIPFGTCITDATGSCAITANDPPRLRSGHIEGFIDLNSYGRQLIGWKEKRLEITLQLSTDGNLATALAPLDRPYAGQTEQPTDAPLSTSTRSPLATVTPVATATISTSLDTPTPEGLTPSAPTPTATTTLLATTPITIQPIDTPTPIPPTNTSQKAQRFEWAWIGLGLVLFSGLGAAFVIQYHRHHTHRQSD